MLSRGPMRRRPTTSATFGSTARTYEAQFRSSTKQRPSHANPDPESPSFERSRAQVLGPGTYDPMPPTWIFEAGRPLSPFASRSAQRGAQKGLLSAHLDFATKDEGDTLSMFLSAPGSHGQSWSPSPRSPPFFHTKSRPYPGMSGDPIGRDDGLNILQYDSTTSTLGGSVDSHPRRYASAFPFREATTRLEGRSLRKDNAANLGPGSYNIHKHAACGGLKVLDEWDRPTRAFAPRVGGKFAHVGGNMW